MVFFLSHCGVTNAVYTSSQFPSAFALSITVRPAIHIDTTGFQVPLPILPAFPSERDIMRRPTAQVSHIATIHFGVEHEGSISDTAHVFFDEKFASRNFFITAFPRPFYTPVAPFQRLGALGQGPNGTTGSSQALSTTFFSGAPSAGSIVVNMACFPYFPPMQTDPRLLGPSISAQPTLSSVLSVASTLGDRLTPVRPYDLVSSYNDLLIYFIC